MTLLNQSAVMIMLIASFLWGVYPAFLVLSEGTISPVLFVLFVHIFCGVSAFLMVFYLVKDKQGITRKLTYITKKLSFDQWLYLGIVGLTSTLYNFCFVYAMETPAKYGATVIIESWPIIAMFLSPVLISKLWNRIRKREIFAGLTALFGVVLIMASDLESLINIFTNFNAAKTDEGFETVLGLLLALLGSFCLAASVVLSAEISNRVHPIVRNEKNASTLSALIAEVIRRIIALPATLLLVWVFMEDNYYTAEGIVYSMIVGVFIFNLGSVAVTIALLKSSSPSINILYYLSPVFAVLFIYSLTRQDITLLTILGAGLIVASNIVILFRRKTAKHL